MSGIEPGGVRGVFALALCAGILLLTGACAVLLRPIWQQIRALKTQIAQHSLVLAEARAAVPKIEAYQAGEHELVERLLRRAGQQIPCDVDLPALLGQLQAAARRAGVEDAHIVTRRPGPLARDAMGARNDPTQAVCRGKGCWRLAVGFSGRGTYRQIASLLEQLRQCERLVSASSVHMNRIEQDRRRLRFEIQLDAYYLGPVERELQ